MKARPLAFLLAFPIFVSFLAAQDMRQRVEPFFAPLCATVDAQLKSSGKTLVAEDEQKVDTARIQRAIDRCGKGRAVRLRVDEDKNAFLTGPLVLKPDVALILDRGVTLFGSRDASLYDIKMGSCGVVSEVPAGCRPLISVEKANGAGLMGDGIVDGRGGEKILNKSMTWWELAAQGNAARVPQTIRADNSNNFTIYRVTLRNSPSDAVVFDHGDGLTIWGVRIEGTRLGAKPVAIGETTKDVVITQTDTGSTNAAK